MTFRERLASWLSPRAAASVHPVPPNFLLRRPYLTEAGVPINPETATQVSAVYGCCRLIVDSLASQPIRVYEVQSGGVRKVLHDDPTSYVLNYGADVSTSSDALPSQAIEEALFWSALLEGNGYAEIQRDRANRFYALWPIEPWRVVPNRDENGRLYYQVTQWGGGVGRVEPINMFHVRGPSLYGWVGDSTLYRAALAAGIAQASQVFASSYFANGTIVAGTLNHPGKVSPEAKRQIGIDWRENYGGPKKAHGTAVLDQGFKYEPLGHKAQEAQLVESRRFQVQEIARFFGVPTTLLADNEAWTNLSELYLGFYRNALLPWAERFDSEATRKLFPQRQPWREVHHDLTRIVMGSFKDQVAALRDAVNGGLKTRNEARAILGDNTLGPEGDVIVIEGSVQTLDTVLDPPEPVIPPARRPPDDPDEDDAEEDSTEEEDDGAPKAPRPSGPGAGDVARVAIALDRFVRRMQARRADLERNAPEKAEANLAEERRRIEPALLSECRAALGNRDGLDMRVQSAADAVLEGEPAHLAAQRLAEAA